MREDNVLKEIKRIKTNIKDGIFVPYYLIYGSETYLINDLKKSFVEYFDKKDNINILTYTEDNYDETKIKEKMSQFGFLREKKIIIFQNLNLFDLKSPHSSFVDLMQYNNTDDNILIFIEYPKKSKETDKDGKCIDKRSKLYKYLFSQENIEILECNHQDKSVLLKFVTSTIYRSKKRFENESDASYFLELVGDDLYNIKNELDKLMNYTEDEYVIKRSDIGNIASVVPEIKIFQMIDMLNNKDYQEALKLYSDLIYNNVAIEMVLSLLKRNYIMLYKVKSMKQEGKSFPRMLDNLKTQDWILQKSINTVSRFSEEDLIKKIDLVTDIDTKLKTGMLDRDIAFNLLLQ